MTHAFDKMVDRPFEGRSVADLLAASPAALEGVTARDAALLAEALGVGSIRDLATHRAVRMAQALLAAAGEPGFDPGPPSDWEAFFRAAPLAHYLAHPAQRFRLAFGPVYYRGRLDGSARVLIVGQDPSTNELLAQRVLVGQSGQRVQGMLAKLGLRRSYVMVNTFLFPVNGQFDATLRAIADEAPILGYRNQLLDRLAQRNALAAVLAIGAGARHAVEAWPGRGALPVFTLVHPAAEDSMVIASWNRELPRIREIVQPDDDMIADTAPYGAAFVPADEAPIPAFDLPFGVPEWHARGGGHSTRQGDDIILWQAP